MNKKFYQSMENSERKEMELDYIESGLDEVYRSIDENYINPVYESSSYLDALYEAIGGF
jgi:hypothetical protein